MYVTELPMALWIVFRVPSYCSLFVFQDMRGLRTLSESDFKAEVDDKSNVNEVLSADNKSIQHKGLQLNDLSLDNVQTCRDTDVNFTLEPSQTAACDVNNIDFSASHELHAAANADDFKSDDDVKPMYSALRGDSTSSDVEKAVDKETSLVITPDSRPMHEVLLSDSSSRVRRPSGVSGTSSTSGGEESPLPGRKSFVPKQLQAQTLTPVNGWSDSACTPLQHVLKEETGVGQRTGLFDGLGNINDTHSVRVDGISARQSPSNLNPAVGLGIVSSTGRIYPGVGQDNRSWLSANTSPQSHWNSGVQISEPFWATSAAPFHPQSQGMSSPMHSPRIGASQMATVPAACGSDGSQTPVSINGSFGDRSNSMQMSPNVSPSTPLSPPSSKKRVCVLSIS